MNNTFFHVGMHKTGSTWMQKNIFLPHKNINFLDHDYIYQNIIHPFNNEFDLILPSIKNNLKDGLNIFSSERLSGNPHSGYYDTSLLIDRMHKISPDAKIIIVLREQKSMIVSCYKQYVKCGGRSNFEEYIFPPDDGRIPLFRLDAFKYDVLVKKYYETFKPENVLIMPYEMLAKDPKNFIEEIKQFILVDLDVGLIDQNRVNKSLNDLQIEAIRLLNNFGGINSLNAHKTIFYKAADLCSGFVKKCMKGKFFQGYNSGYSSKIEKIIGDYFYESNNELKKIVSDDFFNNY